MCAIQVRYYPIKLQENVCIKENVPPDKQHVEAMMFLLTFQILYQRSHA